MRKKSPDVIDEWTKQSHVEQLQGRVEKLQAHFEEAQRRIADLFVVQEVAQSLTSELNLNPLLRKILASAVEVMNASAGSLLLLDHLTNELVFEVIDGGGGDELRGVRMPSDRGIAGWVVTHRKPLIVDDVNQDNRYYQSVAQSFNFKLTSLLAVPMIAHNQFIGVLEVLHSEPGRYFDSLNQQLLTTLANQAAVAIVNARLYETIKEERDRLVIIEDEIRKRIARDLHDGPTQQVAAVIMSLDFIKNAIIDDPEQAREESEYAAEMSQKTIKQLRTLLFDLRPVILETQGLAAALEAYAERLDEEEAFDVSFEMTGTIDRLATKAEGAAFAVVQEAITNAKKYANATKITLTLSQHLKDDLIVIKIADNGQGFDVQQVVENYDKRGSLGLLNMRERASQVDGELNIASTPGEGTVITMSLPRSSNLLATDERNK